MDFKPIDLNQHRQLCIEFRADTFIESFSTADAFFNEIGFMGPQKYIHWLESKLIENKYSCMHLWDDDEIIGQIELSDYTKDPSIGFVMLYYLIPKVRGTGCGKLLDQYAMEFFAQKSQTKARLSVAQVNVRAIQFYQRRGWLNIGNNPDHVSMLLMEKSIVI